MEKEDGDTSRILDTDTYDCGVPPCANNTSRLGQGQLSDYKIHETIGRGEFGIIYRVEHKSEGMYVPCLYLVYVHASLFV
jgi:hypothetical protein